ncbi:uncharacterized protein [Antedon mediterranea]|uniref:uncharacterized protein isoform X2 n=1 Tax=Antedon mediterranea TaxID=105859 RepID=UPI003AF43CC8
MVKICVVSPEGLKDDKKVEGLPVPEVLTEIPLQEKLTINDLATIKNPKRRCKGVVIILVMLTLAVTCLCLASVIYSYTVNNNEEQDMIKNQEPQRFEIDVTFRDPDGVTKEKHELEKTTQYHSTANPLHHLKEEIVVNVDNNTEVFTIPPGEDHEALIFLHDFTHEYTAYLLVEQDLCFVKNISPFMMSPLGFLNILLNPMYFVHEFIVTQTSYIAIPPPLQRLSFGPEIENLCGNSPTFWLEEMDDDEYDTVNVDDLPWMDWGYPDRYIRRKRSADHNEIKNIRFFDADERMHKEKISFGKLAKDK